MKYSKEMKVWIKQQLLGIEYCQGIIDHLKKEINLHVRRIKLEEAQIKEIKRHLEKAKKQWKNTK